MSIIGNIERRMALGATGALADSWYSPGGFFFGGSGVSTKSGTSVSELTAMQLSVVWACIKILSEDTASLPLHLYRRRKGGGKDRAWADDRYSLMHDKPNSEMTAISFRETYASHLLSWGNAYAEMERTGGRVNKVVALWPITPNRVTVTRNDQKKIIYRVNVTGMQGSNYGTVILPKESVLHTPGLSFNGLVGYSPIAAARESIGLGMALEEFGELYFGQGTHPGVIISHPSKLSPQAHSNMTNSLATAHSGLGKSHRLMLLEEGMKIEKISIPNDEAQWLEGRKYQNIDIGSRIYRLPPQMYGEYDKASTYASSEQFSIDYVTRTLRSWLVRLEQSYNAALLDDSERGVYFFEHSIEGLLRGDIQTRYTAYAVARNNGWMNADEIRELENMNPMEGGQGKIYLVPLNMIPATEAGKTVEPAQPDQKANSNRQTYKKRLENAYRGIFADAAGRITRKEVKAVRQLLKKHEGNGFDAAIAEFYRELPEFIRKQMLPVIYSYSEAIAGMECEMNGLKYDELRAEIERFATLDADYFAERYVEKSLDGFREAVNVGSMDATLNDWESKRAVEIATNEAEKLAEKVIGRLKALSGAVQ